MKLISEQDIKKWQTRNGNMIFPSIINVNCAHCGRLQVFNVSSWTPHQKAANYIVVKCAVCDKVIIFFYVDLCPAENETIQGTLYMYPNSNLSQERRPKDDILQLGDDWERVKKAYVSAIDVYNAGVWPATLGECRRTLEGISKKLVTDDNISKLHKRIEMLPQRHDLQKPILDLAFLVKEGGNLGAHFDNEKDPDQELATMMLDLLEYLIEYLFVLPARIDSIRTKVEE